MRRLILICVLGLATVMPRVAVADGPTAREKKKARKLVLSAGRHKRKGDKYAKHKSKRYKKKAAKEYRAAVTAYLESFSLVEDDDVVFKLAEVYRARGESRWALRGYEHYLELQPNGSHAESAQAQVDALTAALADAGEDEGVGPNDLDPTAVFGLEPPPPEEKPEPPPEAKPEPKPAPEPEPEPLKTRPAPKKHPGRLLEWGGIGAGGVGAVLLTVGIVYGVKASSAASSLSNNTDQWNQNDKQNIRDGQSASDKMVLFTSLGLATMAVGGVVYYLGMRADAHATDERVVVAPQLGAGTMGVAVSGSF